MPKKRKRSRSRNWSPLLWFCFAVNIGVGLAYSPLTVLRSVKVVGAAQENRPYLKSIVDKLNGKPALQISSLDVENRVLATSAVQMASFSRNVFGRATLTLAYRKPTARFESDPNLFIDRGGVVFRSFGYSQPLPLVDVYSDALRPNLAITGAWPAERAAFLAVTGSKYSGEDSVIVEVDATGAVSLRIGAKTTIRFGAPYDLESKLGKLDELLQEHPNLLAEARSINLVEPTRPTWIPKSVQ